MVRLGDQVSDRLTGLTGTVTSRAEWLYGCVRVAVQPRELKDGQPVNEQWFDEERVEVTTAGVEQPKTAPATGGPQRDPARSDDPG